MALQLIDGAEAKAYYGLVINYGPLKALVEKLMLKETLSGKEVRETLEGAGVIKFPDPYVEGFGWGEDGMLNYPGMPTKACTAPRPALCQCAQSHLHGYKLPLQLHGSLDEGSHAGSAHTLWWRGGGIPHATFPVLLHLVPAGGGCC
jgi:hypothetical protein